MRILTFLLLCTNGYCQFPSIVVIDTVTCNSCEVYMYKFGKDVNSFVVFDITSSHRNFRNLEDIIARPDHYISPDDYFVYRYPATSPNKPAISTLTLTTYTDLPGDPKFHSKKLSVYKIPPETKIIIALIPTDAYLKNQILTGELSREVQTKFIKRYKGTYLRAAFLMMDIKR